MQESEFILSRTNCGAMTSLEDLELNEVLHPDTTECPACASPITPAKTINNDVYGGKHFAYNLHICTWCGWWNIFKFCENPSTNQIYWAQQMAPHVRLSDSIADLDHEARHVEVECLIKFLAKHPGQLAEIHWRSFEHVAREILRDEGHDVVDISKRPTAGGDMLAIDANGKHLVGEVKHYDPGKSKKVGPSVVWKLLGVLETEGYDSGVIITSYRLSSNAVAVIHKDFKKRAPLGADQPRIRTYELADVQDWLASVERRQMQAATNWLETFIANDAMMEM